MKNAKLLLWSVIDSFGAFVYILAVALFLNNANKLFGQGPGGVLTAVAMLLLLVLSATITGSLVLGRPAYLYLGGFKSEAVKLLIYTIVCLFVITLAVLVVFAVK